MIDYALAFAAQGYRVFPLAANAKVPAIPKARGGRGCLDATTSAETIERWWAEYPEANVRIATDRARRERPRRDFRETLQCHAYADRLRASTVGDRV